MAWKNSGPWIQNGTQGFDTRRQARAAADALATYRDPERPNLRWAIKRIHPEIASNGTWHWIADRFYRRLSA